MKGYIGIHEPVLDSSGTIIECHLVKWNRAYSAVRNKTVEQGQSLLETYYNPLDALHYVNRAWNEGSCEQIFFMGNEIDDKYRKAGEIVYITVVWERVDNRILEISDDLTDFKKLQLKLQAQEIAVLEAESLATLVEERERIGREMHDSIIQQLYAATLTLRSVSTDCESLILPQLLLAIKLIEDTIIEIRDQVMNINEDPIVDVQHEIFEIFQVISSGSNTSMKVEHDPRMQISSTIAPHVRSVLKEATSNAVRHGHANSITYTCYQSAGFLEVTITDDGVGFTKDSRRGSGLVNMDQRAEILGGHMEVLANSPHGTCIKWVVPTEIDAELL